MAHRMLSFEYCAVSISCWCEQSRYTSSHFETVWCIFDFSSSRVRAFSFSPGMLVISAIHHPFSLVHSTLNLKTLRSLLLMGIIFFNYIIVFLNGGHRFMIII